MTNLEFFQQSLKNLKTVGTVTRTSKYVSKAITDLIDARDAGIIVELGAGDGAITQYLLKKMQSGGKLIVFEINERFCQKLRELNDSRLTVIQDSAEHLGDHLNRLGIPQADVVVSAIPFVALPDERTDKILRECRSCLKPKGLFVQINYSLIKKKLYEKTLGPMEVEWVPFNLPPVFVLHSRK